MMKTKIILFILPLFLLIGCQNIKNNSIETLEVEESSEISNSIDYINVPVNNIKENIEEESFIIEEKKSEVQKATLIAVGDNLIHSMIIKSGLKEDGSRDYNYMYEEIKPFINEADIKVINQETIFINDSSKYSGYPVFGSPIEIGEAITNCGFNLITHATNHSYDKKEEGILDTINFWKEKNIPYLGIHDSFEESQSILIKEYNGITFAFSNYTYGLNGFSLPSDKEYLVDTFMDNSKKDKMIENISKAKDLADFNVVFIHWGTEYTIKETKEQEILANEIANAGADIIIGTHPHVIEPLKYIETSDGRNVPVFYSLGNFISNQDKLDTMLGGLAKVSFVKQENNCYIDSCELIPLVTHIENNQKYFKVYLLNDYSEDLSNTHKLYKNGLSFKFLKDRFNLIINQN